jgi:hypothetical protein
MTEKLPRPDDPEIGVDIPEEEDVDESENPDVVPGDVEGQPQPPGVQPPGADETDEEREGRERRERRERGSEEGAEDEL